MQVLPFASVRKTVRPVRLFFSAIYAREAPLERFTRMMRQKFSENIAEAGDFPFDHTDYYSREMGHNLRRKIFFVRGLYPRSLLPHIKLLSREWEIELAEGEKRVVNIDPGFMTLEQACLLTFKNYYHRFYLGFGVYGEVTLFFKKGTFRPFDWTYPDYREEDLISVFNKERDVLKREYAAGGWL